MMLVSRDHRIEAVEYATPNLRQIGSLSGKRTLEQAMAIGGSEAKNTSIYSDISSEAESYRSTDSNGTTSSRESDSSHGSRDIQRRHKHVFHQQTPKEPLLQFRVSESVGIDLRHIEMDIHSKI